MNKNWNFTRNLGTYKTKQEKYYVAEKDFKVDLNGDGTIGYKLKSIESIGNDELLKDNFNGFHVKDEKGKVYEILKGGKRVKSNSIWELKVAETIGRKNLVINQNIKNKNFNIWEMSKNWDFVRDSGNGLYQTNHERYYEIEEILGIDLDNDKIIVKEATATGLLTALGVLVSIILFFFKTSKSTES